MKLIIERCEDLVCAQIMRHGKTIGFREMRSEKQLAKYLNSFEELEQEKSLDIELYNFDLSKFYICYCDSLVEYVRKPLFMKIIEEVS